MSAWFQGTVKGVIDIVRFLIIPGLDTSDMQSCCSAGSEVQVLSYRLVNDLPSPCWLAMLPFTALSPILANLSQIFIPFLQQTKRSQSLNKIQNELKVTFSHYKCDLRKRELYFKISLPL